MNVPATGSDTDDVEDNQNLDQVDEESEFFGSLESAADQEADAVASAG
jgi:hypothetical protein